MNKTLRIFKALADETRLRLYSVLLEHELSVNELVSLLEVGQSGVSRNLKILLEAELLSSRRDGLWVFYSANKENNIHELIRSIIKNSDGQVDFSHDLKMAEHIIEDRLRKTRQFFNSIADDWDHLSKEVLGDFDLAKNVVNLMPYNCKVAVDLGCGTGSVLELMQGKAEQIIGVDGSSRMLELSRRRFAKSNHDISLRIGELDHLPLKDGESDFVCLNMVLHHLSEPAIALDEIKRVLKKGGTLLITDFDKHELEKMRKAYGDRWLGFTKETIDGYLKKSGFSLKETYTFPVKLGLGVNIFLANNE